MLEPNKDQIFYDFDVNNCFDENYATIINAA